MITIIYVCIKIVVSKTTHVIKLYVASSRAWRLVWEGGLDLLTRPTEEKKTNPEVDNWTNWPPGQITGSTEDSIVKRPASNSLQPKNKVKISAVWHPRHCRDVCKEWNSSVALLWSFPSCSCPFAEAESKSTERHAVRNCSQSYLFPG